MDSSQVKTALGNQNVAAFLRCIRQGESNQTDSAYRLVNGGGLFNDFSAHPYGKLPTTQGGRAAGAYQFLPTTFADVQARYPAECPDFSPASQDFAAVVKIADRGALNDVIAGNFQQAVAECRKEWTSLPGASENAAGNTLAKYLQVYEQYGGHLADTAQPPAPVTDESVEARPQDKQSAATAKGTSVPVALALMPLLTQLIPQLIGVFKPGSQLSAQATAAAQVVSDAVTTATNSPNLQAAIEKMQSDPDAKQAAATAVTQVWYQITEVGGGIEGARKGAVTQGALPLWKNVAFIVTALLMPAVYIVIYAVLFRPDYSEQMRTVVVTAVITGLLGSITGYFLGSSLGSSKKDDTIQAQTIAPTQ